MRMVSDTIYSRFKSQTSDLRDFGMLLVGQICESMTRHSHQRPSHLAFVNSHGRTTTISRGPGSGDPKNKRNRNALSVGCSLVLQGRNPLSYILAIFPASGAKERI